MDDLSFAPRWGPRGPALRVLRTRDVAPCPETRSFRAVRPDRCASERLCESRPLSQVGTAAPPGFRTQRTVPGAARVGPGISSFRIMAPRWSSAYRTVAIEASGVLPTGTMSPRAMARSVSSLVPSGRPSSRRTLKAASRYVTCRTVSIAPPSRSLPPGLSRTSPDD
jgi:hypothetical protein